MLINMPASEFNAHIESVIALLLEKPKKMSQQATRYWSQILRQRYDFDRCKFPHLPLFSLLVATDTKK